jgi:hypothetical protein
MQLDLIGVMQLDANLGPQISPEFPFVPLQRYGVFVVYDGSAQSLTPTDDTNNFLTLTPLEHRIEAAS